MRVVVIGGTGNFGGRIARALRGEANVELVVAGRSVAPRPSDEVARAALDIRAGDFAQRLAALAPGLVIHCVGPFQGQDYRVAAAALGARSHYLDLADGRDFVASFKKHVHPLALANDRVALCGASTLPALSSAAVDALGAGMAAIESVDVIIAPGQRAPRGPATLAAVFSYLGTSFAVWRKGRWERTWGWMDLRVARLDIGARLSAACDVPDLALFPSRYPSAQSIRFGAALEFRLQHLVLWMLAGLRRVGLPLPVVRCAIALNHLAPLFDPFAGNQGGMSVSVTGFAKNGIRIRRSWQLCAPALEGPDIPCISAIVLARRLVAGHRYEIGAHPCMGFLNLTDFEPEFNRRGITTRIAESSA
jgi:hypothetical protein